MKMNFRDAILDALVDDGESIKQISEYLGYLDIEYSERIVISTISSLLTEKLIRIAYPNDKTIYDFEIANDKEKLDFWFELTEYGYAEWNKIE